MSVEKLSTNMTLREQFCPAGHGMVQLEHMPCCLLCGQQTRQPCNVNKPCDRTLSLTCHQQDKKRDGICERKYATRDVREYVRGMYGKIAAKPIDLAPFPILRMRGLNRISFPAMTVITVLKRTRFLTKSVSSLFALKSQVPCGFGYTSWAAAEVMFKYLRGSF